MSEIVFFFCFFNSIFVALMKASEIKFIEKITRGSLTCMCAMFQKLEELTMYF